MSKSLAKIWARKIHSGDKTIEDVEAKYGNAGVTAVRQAYFELFGEEI